MTYFARNPDGLKALLASERLRDRLWYLVADGEPMTVPSEPPRLANVVVLTHSTEYRDQHAGHWRKSADDAPDSCVYFVIRRQERVFDAVPLGHLVVRELLLARKPEDNECNLADYFSREDRVRLTAMESKTTATSESPDVLGLLDGILGTFGRSFRLDCHEHTVMFQRALRTVGDTKGLIDLTAVFSQAQAATAYRAMHAVHTSVYT